MLYKNVPWCRECCRRVWKIVVKHKGIVLILSGWGKKLTEKKKTLTERDVLY